jgi:predicted  nucleic acid-binding Zn-ribbon protein
VSEAPPAGFHDLATMIEFLGLQGQKLGALEGELSQVQKEFETHFVASRAQVDDLKAAITAQVDEGEWQQPAWLVEQVNALLPEVRAAKQKRQTELEKELADLTRQLEQIEGESTKDRGQIQANNPQLNTREEALKQQQAGLQQVIATTQADLTQAGRGLGWLLRAGKVHALRHALDETALQLYGVNERLTEVRNSWATLEKKIDDNETALQQAWRLRVAEVARLKAEQAALQRDFEGTCRDIALDQALEALAAVQPTSDPKLDERLGKLLDWHAQNHDYEGGIARMAELIGLLKGLAEGLARMAVSVQSVQEEQEMHAELSTLKLQVPAGCLEFHSLWDQLGPVVADEKEAGAHPRDLAAKLEGAIGDRLADKAIDAMFTALGDELNRATKEQW